MSNPENAKYEMAEDALKSTSMDHRSALAWLAAAVERERATWDAVCRARLRANEAALEGLDERPSDAIADVPFGIPFRGTAQ